MKFITYNENFEIQLIHNMPFDEVNGLGKSEEELLKIGALVEEIPNVEVPSDKNVIYKYNQESNTVTYELVDRPLTVEEQNKKSIEEMAKVNSMQDEMIDICMLATDEMYMLIEPILGETFNLKMQNSNMANMYAAMIQRGLKTIDDIPGRYKQQVEEILK